MVASAKRTSSCLPSARSIPTTRMRLFLFFLSPEILFIHITNIHHHHCTNSCSCSHIDRFQSCIINQSFHPSHLHFHCNVCRFVWDPSRVNSKTSYLLIPWERPSVGLPQPLTPKKERSFLCRDHLYPSACLTGDTRFLLSMGALSCCSCQTGPSRTASSPVPWPCQTQQPNKLKR